MNPTNEDIISYTATSVSVLARFIFMYLLYEKKSINNLSLTFCILNIMSSGMWIYYGIQINNMPILVRSSADISLLTISSLYIIRNKIMLYRQQISPTNSFELCSPEFSRSSTASRQEIFAIEEIKTMEN